MDYKQGSFIKHKKSGRIFVIIENKTTRSDILIKYYCEENGYFNVDVPNKYSSPISYTDVIYNFTVFTDFSYMIKETNFLKSFKKYFLDEQR